MSVLHNINCLEDTPYRERKPRTTDARLLEDPKSSKRDIEEQERQHKLVVESKDSRIEELQRINESYFALGII